MRKKVICHGKIGFYDSCYPENDMHGDMVWMLSLFGVLVIRRQYILHCNSLSLPKRQTTPSV